jgi:hypothetical protein
MGNAVIWNGTTAKVLPHGGLVDWQGNPIGGGGNSFGIVQPPNGTSPSASTPDDTLIMTSSDSNVVLTGNAGTKTIDHKLSNNVNINSCSASNGALNLKLQNQNLDGAINIQTYTGNRTLNISYDTGGNFLFYNGWSALNLSTSGVTIGPQAGHWTLEVQCTDNNTATSGPTNGSGFVQTNTGVGVNNFSMVGFGNQSGKLNSWIVGVNEVQGNPSTGHMEIFTSLAGTAVQNMKLMSDGSLVLGPASATPKHSLNTSTSAAASGSGTLTNMPTGVSGNPTGYIKITINGSDRVIPYW